jgi:hypothetical protein
MATNNRPALTEDMARAAGRDAANRRMRAAGRTVWNRADFNLAARTLSTLSPVGQALMERHEAEMRARVEGGR